MRIATWNIGSAMGRLSESIDQISEIIEKNGVDVVCLQEVVTSGNISFIEMLMQRLGFGYHASFELSSAHVDDTTQMGVAIISKFKILEQHQIKLKNPNLSIKKGTKTIISDNKGFLCAEIINKGKKLNVVTGHMLPFHSFGSDSSEHVDSYTEMYEKIAPYCKSAPSIVCGDFNSSKILQLIPQLGNEYQSAFQKPTRYNGKQNDYVFVSKEWNIENERVESVNEFDHFFCAVEVELKTNSDISVLHLSDLHYGSLDQTIDQKTVLPNVKKSDIRVTRFSNILGSVKDKINYVVISGDVTTQGAIAGYKEFNSFARKMQKKGVFPPSNHFVVVPGNHDTDAERDWVIYDNLLDGKCVRPWLEKKDPGVEELISSFRLIDGDIFGTSIDEETGTEIHYPLLLDRKNHILIYAFNSSSISQSEIELSTEDRELLARLKASKTNKDVKRVIALLEKELKVDPARIDPQELFLFRSLIDELNNKIDLSSYYKIAVFHHHITNISCDEEIKKFDEILNGGQLKRDLVERDFQVVMHGHKHNPDVFFDSAIASHRPLLVASGGTVFGFSTGKHGFYKHDFQKNIMKSAFYSLEDECEAYSLVNKIDGDFYFKNGITLNEIFAKVESTVTQHINEDLIEGKKFVGWSKNIEEKKVGSISSVYGILIMELLGGKSLYYHKKKQAILDSLWSFRHKSGGWGAVSQITSIGAPEATAWVTLAFYRAHSDYFQTAITDLNLILDRMIDSINSNFTFALCTLVLCEVDPQNKRIQICCDKLLDSAIRDNNKIEYWCSKCKPKLMYNVEPSSVHTAIAVIALYKAQKVCAISRDLKTELEKPFELLSRKDQWNNKREAIAIQIGNKEDSLIVDYYTAPWVIRALIEKEGYLASSVIQSLINLIIDDYQNGYWDYNGEHYIWAIYDSISALKDLSLIK